MKKAAMIACLSVLLNVSLPVIPQAHAASVLDNLTQVMEQSQNVTRVQQLLALKQNLEQGNKAEVMQMLAREALTRSNISPVANTVVTGGGLNDMISTAVKDQLQQKVTDRLGPYQQQINVISMLLNSQNLLNPQAVQENSSLTGAPQTYRRVVDMTATAYGPGYPDNGKWGNQTYMGGSVHKGVAAVDPNVIPLGSKLWIEGYGMAIAEDEGSAIKGNRIDLAFDNRQTAQDYGIKNVKVYILN